LIQQHIKLLSTTGQRHEATKYPAGKKRHISMQRKADGMQYCRRSSVQVD